MSEYIHLTGAEDVRRAGGEMHAAADSMRSAASHFESSVDRLKQILDDFLFRFEEIKNKPQ